MNQSQLFSLLNQAATKAVYFGPQGFVLASTEDELATYQQGFAVHPDGTILSGVNAGDWQRSWQVIAIDTELGDPYFVDTSNKLLPVYTAVQANGLWQAEPIASSLDGFLECLALLYKYGKQENALFVPDETTIADKIILKQLNDSLVKTSGFTDFWTLFFECYLDWLEDDD